MQGGNRDTDRTVKWPVGRVGGGTNWEIRADVYAAPRVNRQRGGSAGRSAQGSVLTRGWGAGWGGRGAPEGEGTCIHMADSLCFTAETDTTL